MERIQYAALQKNEAVMIIWDGQICRDEGPLRELCVLWAGKHLLWLKHYNFL